MAQRKDISIQFIAEKCGVSTATVSRVLNSDRCVSDKTRARVWEALNEYHYVAPASARANPRIGVIIDSELSDYYMALVTKVRTYMKQAALQTLLISLGNDASSLSACLDTLYDSGVSGVVLISCSCQSIREQLRPDLPHVWIDCNDPYEQTRDICQVQSDQYYSGVLSAREFLKKGCRRPIILTGSSVTHRAIERERGFRDAFAEAGVTVSDDQIVRLSSAAQDVLAETRRALQYMVYQKAEFDCVFAISDWRALGAYLTLTELGLRVPEDVKLIGYVGVSAASRSALNITSVQQNIDRIALSACELLLKLLRGEPIAQRRVIVPTDILPGQTI